MIRKSFVFLEKITPAKEKKIRNQGINTWDDFLAAEKIKGISDKSKKYYDKKIREARKHLYEFDSKYFAKHLAQKEHWRLYDFFKDEAVYLDIEISGHTKKDDITVIGLFDGYETKTMVNGVNLDYHKLKQELKKYKLIVTFNGSVFDVPYIRKRYGDIIPNIPHFDLRFAAKKIGLAGGLKEIEKQLGIQRPEIVNRMYGGDAILLRRKWLATGDEDFLKLLIEYNEEDTINLQKIASYCYEELVKNINGTRVSKENG